MKGDVYMDNKTFNELPDEKKIKTINEMLKNANCKEVAKALGISTSSISKLMTGNQYIHIPGINKYCRYLLDDGDITSIIQGSNKNDVLMFLEEHFETLKQLLVIPDKAVKMTLDERICRQENRTSNKNIKINDDIYAEFIQLYREKYAYLKVQDVFSQALVEFIIKYQSK